MDGSLDWGQDLPSLKGWLDEENANSDKPVYLANFGTSRPEYYRTLGPYNESQSPLEEGIYAMSATRLQGVYDGTQDAWTAGDEATYRRLLREARSPELDTESGHANERARLRFKRLTVYLRSREPDASAGYSILIYRLTQGRPSTSPGRPSARTCATSTHYRRPRPQSGARLNRACSEPELNVTSLSRSRVHRVVARADSA